MSIQTYLTKSKYLHGLQCHKRLWYEKNPPEGASPPSRAQERTFRQGTEVGERARTLFPEGRLIHARNLAGLAAQTQNVIRDGVSCIFEGTFYFSEHCGDM